MKVATDLKKSIAEVMQFSVHELALWAAYYKLKHDEEKNKVMNNGRANTNRASRRR